MIRRAVAAAGQTLEGDAEEEESDADNEEERTPKRPTGAASGASGARRGDPASSPLAAVSRLPGGRPGDESEEEDGPLFPEQQTPTTRPMPLSSSPFLPPSSARDYSSDLDSSPVRPPLDLNSSPPRGLGDEDDDEEEREREKEERRRRREEERAEREREERHRARRRAARPERTRHYEVVGVVRKKIVFALR